MQFLIKDMPHSLAATDLFLKSIATITKQEIPFTTWDESLFCYETEDEALLHNVLF